MRTYCSKFIHKISKGQKWQQQLLLLLAILAHSSALSAASISGRVSLPTGNVASSGGLQIFYQARDLQPTSPENSQSTFSVITAGSSFVDFNLSVPDNATAQWEVKYSCSWQISVGCRDYVQTGFYFDDGGSPATSYKEVDAETVAENSTNIDMTVLQGTEFSGSMTMPAGTAPADFDYNIFVFTPDFVTFNDNAKFTIKMGSNTGNFRVTAPNDAALDYNVRYQCLPGFCEDNYPINGFFDPDAADNTTESVAQAEDLPGNFDVTTIDMTFLTGTTISGTISLPSGTATDDIQVDMQALDVSNGNLPARTSVLFTTGDAAKNYTINAADDVLADWQISYFCNSLLTPDGCDDFFEQGFYDVDDVVDTTTDSVAEADTLVGGVDYPNMTDPPIDLTLIVAASISGTVSLDAGMLAPVGGLDISVGVNKINAGGGLNEFDNIHIVADTNSSNYTISIPDDTSNVFEVSYFCRLPSTIDACPAHTTNGFFDFDAPGTTTFDIIEAEELTGSSSYTNINLTVFKLDDGSFIVIPLQGGKAVVVPSG